jgi:hypothetical protein
MTDARDELEKWEMPLGEALAKARQYDERYKDTPSVSRTLVKACDRLTAERDALRECAQHKAGCFSERTRAMFHADLMVTDDDASSIHWRKAGCCDNAKYPCGKFFDGGPQATAEWLYQPWRRLYEKAKP